MINDQSPIINRIYRWLPDFKGKQRLGRLIFKTQILNVKNLIVKGKSNIKYLLPNLKENIGYEIFINGIYERETSDFIISRIPEGGTFIDVGANIGSISLPIFLSKKKITGICIEASRVVYAYLVKNHLLNNLDHITLVNLAISDKDDDIVKFYSPSNQFGKGHFAHDAKEEIETISTITLDSLVEKYNVYKPDLIKIDIEGYEYYALKGAEEILNTPNAPDIVFEFEDWAEARAEGLEPGLAQSFLFEKGYKLFVLNKGEPKRIKSPKLKGSYMIWASKKSA